MVVEDDMELGRDMLCLRVVYQWYVCRVIRRETDEHSLSNLAIPFGDLFPVLKFRVKHVHWAAEDMCSRKVRFMTLHS